VYNLILLFYLYRASPIFVPSKKMLGQGLNVATSTYMKFQIMKLRKFL